MELDTSRFFSHRLVYKEGSGCRLEISNSFWDWCLRLISWVWSPTLYSDENRRTIRCFKKYLIDRLGENRLQRICGRYHLNFESMERAGSPLLSRDVAKIVVGARCVNVSDIEEYLQACREAGDPRFSGKEHFVDLDRAALAEVESCLSRPFEALWELAPISGKISGRPTEWLSRFYFDPFLADRERLQLVEDHSADPFEAFIHNMAAKVIKRDMHVGDLIRGPDHPNGNPQFYYLSARVVSGEGMVSFVFHPATGDTNLQPIRFFRGTSARSSDLDAASSVINDFERDLGRRAYESGFPYDEIMKGLIEEPKIVAGHSLGAAIASYYVVNSPRIEEAFLFAGPGLPEREIQKFNHQNRRVHLIIRRVANDWHTVGEAHLGYQAPPNVRVDFLKYHHRKKPSGEDRHVTIWSKEPYLYGVEQGMTPERRDRDLYHKFHPMEQARSLFGPSIACVLRLCRTCIRSLVTSRIHLEQGLKIGLFKNGVWQVEHFLPNPYNLPA